MLTSPKKVQPFPQKILPLLKRCVAIATNLKSLNSETNIDIFFKKQTAVFDKIKQFQHDLIGTLKEYDPSKFTKEELSTIKELIQEFEDSKGNIAKGNLLYHRLDVLINTQKTLTELSRELSELFEELKNKVSQKEIRKFFKNLSTFTLVVKTSFHTTELNNSFVLKDIFEDKLSLKASHKIFIDLMGDIQYLQSQVNNLQSFQPLYDFYLEQAIMSHLNFAFKFCEITGTLPIEIDFNALFNLSCKFTQSDYAYASFFRMVSSYFLGKGDLFNACNFLNRALEKAVNQPFYWEQDQGTSFEITGAIADDLLKVDWKTLPFNEVYKCFMSLKGLNENKRLKGAIDPKTYNAIKCHVEAVQKSHWSQLQHIRDELKHICPDLRLTPKRVYALSTHTPGFIKLLEKKLRQGRCTLGVHLESNVLVTDDLYLVPLSEVTKFRDIFTVAFHKHKKSNQLKNIEKDFSSLHLEDNAQLSSTYVESMELQSQSETISGHAYLKTRAVEKSKNSDTVALPSSKAHVDDSSKLLDPVTLFGKDYSDLDIKPCQMLSMFNTCYYVAMRKDVKDNCPEPVRKKLEKLFEVPMQCAAKGQTGFKLRGSNNGIILEGKILGKGGKYRALPSQRVKGKDGAVLYIYDEIVKKDSPSEKNPVVNNIINNNNVVKSKKKKTDK